MKSLDWRILLSACDYPIALIFNLWVILPNSFSPSTLRGRWTKLWAVAKFEFTSAPDWDCQSFPGFPSRGGPHLLRLSQDIGTGAHWAAGGIALALHEDAIADAFRRQRGSPRQGRRRRGVAGSEPEYEMDWVDKIQSSPNPLSIDPNPVQSNRGPRNWIQSSPIQTQQSRNLPNTLWNLHVRTNEGT